jgi:D-alanyl-D-alanine carboxypeptidase
VARCRSSSDGVRKPRTLAALVAVAAVIALTASAVAVSAPRGLGPALSTALSREARQTRSPGAQASVYRCGRLVWAGATGTADLSNGRPVTADTRFVLASVTKTYVATMIMQLVERGRLRLDTRLSRYYPALPNASRITVRMLLTHTSGLADYENGPAMSAHGDDPLHHWSRAEVLRDLGPPLFRPGTHFRYTNTNFVVLGGILERAGGRSVEAALRTGVGRPLGLTRTSFTSPQNGSPLFAHPYETRAGGALADGWIPGHGLPTIEVGPVWTDGGLATTATELARFGDALNRAVVVSPATLRAMTTFDRFGTGLGLYPAPFDGRTWFGHSGSYGGFESELWHDPSRGVTVAVVTNRDEPENADDSISDRIWTAVAQAYDDRAAVGACG